MLFLVGEFFWDVVRENTYQGVSTVRSNSRESLLPLRRLTPGRAIKVPDLYYGYVLHVPTAYLALEIPEDYLRDVELVNPITPKPQAFSYIYSYENEEGEAAIERGYCWAGEEREHYQKLSNNAFYLLEPPVLVPLFGIPRQLIESTQQIQGDTGE
jgi:hypothetical protein